MGSIDEQVSELKQNSSAIQNLHAYIVPYRKLFREKSQLLITSANTSQKITVDLQYKHRQLSQGTLRETQINGLKTERCLFTK